MTAPEWMKKHPCESCGVGYGMCAQGANSGRQCCKACSHPSRWVGRPWAAAEFAAAWEGHEMNDYTKRQLQDLIDEEAKA